MKIRIIGANKDTYWYADKVGETFESTGKDGISGGLLVVHEGVRDRYVVQPGDYEVVSDESAPISGITVLPDESLGGIQREYREVKRKARVGERVKVVAITFSGFTPAYAIDDVLTVTHFDDDDFPVIDRKFSDGGEVFLDAEEYVVLEPTDIVYVDNADGVSRKYRMVDRKAAVGERVIIVREGGASGGGLYYRVGNTAIVESAGNEDIRVRFDTTGGKGPFVSEGDYRVLEPLASADSAPATLLSSRSYADQIAENIAALTAQIQSLESRVAALESDRPCGKIASGPVDTTPPSFIKTPQEIRDEIVERAKADVVRLIDECLAVSKAG